MKVSERVNPVGVQLRLCRPSEFRIDGRAPERPERRNSGAIATRSLVQVLLLRIAIGVYGN
jgi:hypothetical protein